MSVYHLAEKEVDDIEELLRNYLALLEGKSGEEGEQDRIYESLEVIAQGPGY